MLYSPAAATASGVMIHAFMFRHGEWDIKGPQIVLIYLLITFALIISEASNRSQVSAKPLSIIGYHILGLYGSMIVYRGFLHRLSRARIPGPFLARFSNFHIARLTAKALHLHDEIHMLHEQYGDYVRIAERHDEPFEVTEWIERYSFEVMGNLTFGKAFDMLKGGKAAYFLEVIRHDMDFIGYLLHLPWLSYLFMRTPILNANHLSFWKWIEKEFAERIEPDIFNWIYEAYLKGQKTKEDTLKLQGDGYLIIVAGSDTTSSTITHLLFHLACDRLLAARLRQQINSLIEVSNATLQNIPLLDACINETLRLHPAVPAGLQRVTPDEGIYIGDRYIPGDVIVKVPMYSMFRDPRVFEQPEEFIPERFTTRTELVLDPSIFRPFLTGDIGSYACVGRRLALMEIRRVIASILQSYEISLGPFQTKESFLDKKIDAFTLVPGPLVLQFTKIGKPS
ncbi:cytochrome P450 monooxygenase [Fusarium beomiforme]|uniref:Cytochrome P450 monooxygenase n=1 Tax=Fusarium beomiforme TaxID=44412 RepID=A0A9P5DRE5_9HYPO|nr:cytochrome P450 monooxygenase [Fusarium beomiforme]